MRPIWIVDDDQSIRFVLEKALAREDLAVRSFTNPRDVLAAMDENDEPQVLVSGRDGGSGLGLTLAQTFVQQHHGLVECDSVPGRTDFKILIPLP